MGAWQGKILLLKYDFLVRLMSIDNPIGEVVMATNNARERAERLIDEATVKSASGDYVGAITLLDKAITLDPSSDEALFERAIVKNKIRLHNNKLGLYKAEETIQAFDEVIRLNPDNHSAWDYRGSIKVDCGRYEEAIKDCDEVIRLNSKSDTAWSNRGVAKTHLGLYIDAIKDLDEAIRLNPKDYKAWNSRGVAKANLGRYVDAIKDFDKAIILNSACEFWNNRGNAKQALGLHAEANKDFNLVIRRRNLRTGTAENKLHGKPWEILLFVFGGLLSSIFIVFIIFLIIANL